MGDLEEVDMPTGRGARKRIPKQLFSPPLLPVSKKKVMERSKQKAVKEDMVIDFPFKIYNHLIIKIVRLLIFF